MRCLVCKRPPSQLLISSEESPKGRGIGKYVAVLLLASCTTFDTLPWSERFYQVVIDTTHDKRTEYRIANEWLVDMFVAAEHVIHYQDKEEGIIKGKSKLLIRPTRPADQLRPDFTTESDAAPYVTAQSVDFTFTIEIKDKRVRVTFDDMQSFLTGGFTRTDLYNAVLHAAFVKEAEGVIESLEIAFLTADLKSRYQVRYAVRVSDHISHRVYRP